jgi:hypothetical protein
VESRKSRGSSARLAHYGISRIDDPVHRGKGWRVSLRRRGTLFVRNFPDLKYGGRNRALTAAKEYRDDIVRQNPPITRVEFAETLRRNNTSGVPGVSLIRYHYPLADGSKRQAAYWEAIWPTLPGRSERLRFSVSRHGNRRAFELACAARRAGLHNVEGVFWASARGETPPEPQKSGRSAPRSSSNHARRPTRSSSSSSIRA